MRRDDHGGWLHRGPDPLETVTTAHAEVYDYDPEPASRDEPGPLPRRVPMEALVGWGQPPGPEAPLDSERAYRSPGRAPWADRRGMPAWAWVSIVLGGLFLICGSTALVALFDSSGPVPVVSTSPEEVITTGTCEKKLVGEYGLVASVEATNVSDRARTGVIWVRWPVTGEVASEFTKPITIEPGRSEELLVNQDVPAERWFRTGSCSFGWTGS